MALQVTPLKESLLLGSLNVALPTVDVYSDIALAVKLYSNVSFVTWGVTYDDNTLHYYTVYSDGHPRWATSLLMPFLFNYFLSWRGWYLKEKENKKYTWIFALLGCYPQLVAGRIIWLFWTKPEKATRERKHLERNFMEIEIFTEAVPSTMIITVLLGTALGSVRDEGCVVFGGNLYLFLTTFATSALSAGLGLAKCLKVASTQYFVLV